MYMKDWIGDILSGKGIGRQAFETSTKGVYYLRIYLSDPIRAQIDYILFGDCGIGAFVCRVEYFKKE